MHRKAAYCPIAIAMTPAHMTNEMGARLGCHAELLKDRTSTIKAQITAINKIAKLAKVPNIPPMHAPVDKVF